MSVERPSAIDVSASVAAVAEALEPAAGLGDAWDGPAGTLTWSCRTTLAHVADCLTWYAAHLARRTLVPVDVGVVPQDAEPLVLLDILRSAGALLAAAVSAAGADDRGWHPFGLADRSGFAGMGCDEALVHGYDLAGGLGVPYEPPADLCVAVLQRLFPWAPEDTEPWPTLLWANGREPLGDRPPETEWLWHCAPLHEWDGQIRRRPLQR